MMYLGELLPNGLMYLHIILNICTQTRVNILVFIITIQVAKKGCHVSLFYCNLQC